MLKSDDSQILVSLLFEGWRDAVNNPPDNDRIVKVAWEDGSYGPYSLAFYDSKSEIPESSIKYWWSWQSHGRNLNMTIFPDDAVLAWRERTNI